MKSDSDNILGTVSGVIKPDGTVTLELSDFETSQMTAIVISHNLMSAALDTQKIVLGRVLEVKQPQESGQTQEQSAPPEDTL